MTPLRAFFRSQFDRITVLSNLPLAPSVNRRLVQGKGKQNKAARGVKTFYNDVGWLAKHQHVKPGIYTKGDRIALLIEYATGMGDISNRVKATEDAITRAGIWHDDANVDVLLVDRICERTQTANVFIGVIR